LLLDLIQKSACIEPNMAYPPGFVAACHIVDEMSPWYTRAPVRGCHASATPPLPGRVLGPSLPKVESRACPRPLISPFLALPCSTPTGARHRSHGCHGQDCRPAERFPNRCCALPPSQPSASPPPPCHASPRAHVRPCSRPPDCATAIAGHVELHGRQRSSTPSILVLN
jgi:hypothetical protein